MPNPSDYWKPPADPRGRCVRAGWLLFVLGGLVSLYFIANFAFTLQATAESMEAVQKQMMAGQSSQVTMPISMETYRNIGLVISGFFTAMGLTMMILASPVRRCRKGATIAAMVVSGGLGLTFIAVSAMCLLAGIVSPVMLLLAACVSVPAGLVVWLLVWLFQAVTAATQLQRAGQQPSTHLPASWQPPTGSTPPPQATQLQPGRMPSVPQSPYSGSSGFGPAPFGIPPPPGEGPGKYGYATKPPEKSADLEK